MSRHGIGTTTCVHISLRLNVKRSHVIGILSRTGAPIRWRDRFVNRDTRHDTNTGPLVQALTPGSVASTRWRVYTLPNAPSHKMRVGESDPTCVVINCYSIRLLVDDLLGKVGRDKQ